MKQYFVGGESKEHRSFWDEDLECSNPNLWEGFRDYIRYCLNKPDVYKLDEFKSWWIVNAIPIWSVSDNDSVGFMNFIQPHVDSFLGKNHEMRWKSCLEHEEAYYSKDHTNRQYMCFGGIESSIHPKQYVGGVRSNATVAVHFIHWITLYQFGIDPKDLDFIFEFGGGVGHVPKLVRKLGFSGKYGIYDFPELSVIQQYYNNMEMVVMNHHSLVDCFFDHNVGGNGLFYSTWGFSESPLHLREKIERNLSKCKYCCILYQDECMSIDNVKYFDDFVVRNSDFDWTSVSLGGYPNDENNTYLIGVNEKYG